MLKISTFPACMFLNNPSLRGTDNQNKFSKALVAPDRVFFDDPFLEQLKHYGNFIISFSYSGSIPHYYSTENKIFVIFPKPVSAINKKGLRFSLTSDANRTQPLSLVVEDTNSTVRTIYDLATGLPTVYEISPKHVDKSFSDLVAKNLLGHHQYYPANEEGVLVYGDLTMKVRYYDYMPPIIESVR